MTEDEARHWLVAELDVPRETLGKIDAFIALLANANRSQNLIGTATLPIIWNRHVVDSAQLLRHAPRVGRWLDVGSGAGFPGIVIALIGGHDMMLVESRSRRAAFLRHIVETLGLRHVEVVCGKVEMVHVLGVKVLSARAVSPLYRLFDSAAHLADSRTLWILPKGRTAASELAVARKSWQGRFDMLRSVTDPEAAIIVAQGVSRRGGV